MKEEFIERVKSEHVGKWIGVKDDKILVVSESHRALYNKLKEEIIEGLYVFY
jgi:hypothetical protein